jgi:hypothetical protein
VKASGPTEGATNGTYKAAYVIVIIFVSHSPDLLPSRYIYFEKVRIAEGKKKTPKREKSEKEFTNGMPLEDRRRMWVFGPA